MRTKKHYGRNPFLNQVVSVPMRKKVGAVRCPSQSLLKSGRVGHFCVI